MDPARLGSGSVAVEPAAAYGGAYRGTRRRRESRVEQRSRQHLLDIQGQVQLSLEIKVPRCTATIAPMFGPLLESLSSLLESFVGSDELPVEVLVLVKPRVDLPELLLTVLSGCGVTS